MEKFIKNPLYQGIAIMLTAVIIIALVWDNHKNPKKDFFGLLPTSTTPVV